METHITNIQIERNESNVVTSQDKALSELIHKVSGQLEEKDEKRRTRLEINEICNNELNNFNLNNIKNKNDITLDLKDLEFEAGFADHNLFKLNSFDFDMLRKKAHIRLVTVIAHATYFVAVANKIRRNFFDIKNGIFKQKSSLLLTEINKEPGLKIGIIGLYFWNIIFNDFNPIFVFISI
jgi:hypothetical protein